MAPDLRDYKRRLLDLLNEEFAIDWRDAGDHTDPSNFARHMLDGYSHLVGPFESLLEYRFRPGEREAYRRHSDAIEVAAAAVRDRWVLLFRDLLILRWPDAANRSTSWTR